MLTLFSVFSDHALFQANASLTLRGRAEPNQAYEAEIRKGDLFMGMAKGVADKAGRLELTLHTPAPSFEPCTITVTGNEEQITLSDILFGELWMATGQSNMELQNKFQPEYACMQKDIAVYRDALRIFTNEYGDGSRFSATPEDDTKGFWFKVDDASALADVSACATSLIYSLIEEFEKEDRRTPVGFLNVSWGGTFISCWIPQEKLIEAGLKDYLKAIDRFSDEENWNTLGELNFQQTSAMFNRKIAPVRGVRVRGVLWYQGEAEGWPEPIHGTYKIMLKLLRSYYSELFAADQTAFTMITSLLYPWTYGDSGETKMSYVNRAFIEAATEEPDHFIFCPLAALTPVWAAHRGNHPIHPTHKYRLGKRMAGLLLTNVYGKEGQKAPATVQSVVREDERILISFRNVGSGLHIVGDTKVRPLYIAGENGVYITAEAEILSGDTLAIWHPYLQKPKDAAYAFSSYEPGSSLWAGDYPVAPFATDEENRFLVMESKPFLNLDADAMWVYDMEGENTPYFRYAPIWKALPGSEICFDTAFAEGSKGLKRSLHIAPEIPFTGKNQNCTYGVSTASAPYKKFDFEHYLGLEADIFHNGKLDVILQLYYQPEGNGSEGKVIFSRFVPVGEASDFFTRYRVEFGELPEGQVEKMVFVFSQEESVPFHFANIGNLTLIPKRV